MSDAVVPVEDERFKVLQTFHLEGVDIDLCVDGDAVKMALSVDQDISSNPVLVIRKASNGA